WCFMILLIANTEFLLNGLFPDYVSFSRLPAGVYHALIFIFDIVSLLVLLAVITALVRRVAFRPSYIDALSRDAFTILALVAILMAAFFGMHASDIARGITDAGSYMPVSGWVAATFMPGTSAGNLTIAANVFWWIHALVLLAFLNYLPYSICMC
ncbi:electron transfer flavoprotein, partial [Chloroflexota bacterium]